jgi:galactitol-specific phosphotransferase system IIB component
MEKETSKLQQKIDFIVTHQKVAKTFGGKVFLGDKIYTLEELEEIEKNLRIQLAVLFSNHGLRQVK